MLDINSFISSLLYHFFFKWYKIAFFLEKLVRASKSIDPISSSSIENELSGNLDIYLKIFLIRSLFFDLWIISIIFLSFFIWSETFSKSSKRSRL